MFKRLRAFGRMSRPSSVVSCFESSVKLKHRPQKGANHVNEHIMESGNNLYRPLYFPLLIIYVI